MNDTSRPNKGELLKEAMFDVEHALGMYATSFITLPAEFIYETELLESHKSLLDSCHIYIIGYLPQVDFIGATQKENDIVLKFSILDNQYDLQFPLQEDLTFGHEEGFYFLENKEGQRFWPSEEKMNQKLYRSTGVLNFEVKYIGQSYGKDGSRSAIDRLLKHETLQKISLKGVPQGFKLSLLLLEIETINQLFTVFNPFAQNKDDDGKRIKAGLDKLFGTTEKERVALYEASLIRYFMPEFNKEFKNSFPSTNLKVLQDCYEKDFASVIAEICIDDLPFKLFSSSIEQKHFHIAKHNLHDDLSRNIFFFGEK